MRFQQLKNRKSSSINEINMVVGGLNSDDALAICGLHPWRSAFEVWCEKTKKIASSKVKSYPTSLDEELIIYIAKLFTEKEAKKLRRCQGILQNNESPWLITAIHRAIVKENAFLECLVANQNECINWKDELPLWCYLKLYHKFAVTKATHCYVAVLIKHREVAVHKVINNKSVIEALIEKEEQFWQLVKQNKLPTPDGSEEVSSAIDKLYPSANKYQKIDLPELASLLSEYDDLLKAEQSILQKLRTIKQIIKLDMGQARTALIGERKVYWCNKNKQEFDLKRLQIELPEIYHKYTTEVQQRNFTIL